VGEELQKIKKIMRFFWQIFVFICCIFLSDYTVFGGFLEPSFFEVKCGETIIMVESTYFLSIKETLTKESSTNYISPPTTPNFLNDNNPNTTCKYISVNGSSSHEFIDQELFKYFRRDLAYGDISYRELERGLPVFFAVSEPDPKLAEMLMVNIEREIRRSIDFRYKLRECIDAAVYGHEFKYSDERTGITVHSVPIDNFLKKEYISKVVISFKSPETPNVLHRLVLPIARKR
jgi:hypothetical protein